MNNQLKWVPILSKEFHHDGRGPELIKACYNRTGSSLIAAEFYNPEDEYRDDTLKHLLFLNPQAFVFIPEEEFAYLENEIPVDESKSAIWNLGKTSWYKSFSNRHSEECDHFRIMFYDEVLDIICKNIEVKKGRLQRQYEVVDTFKVDATMKNKNQSILSPVGDYAIIKTDGTEPRVPNLGKKVNVSNAAGSSWEVTVISIFRNPGDIFAILLEPNSKIEKGNRIDLE